MNGMSRSSAAPGRPGHPEDPECFRRHLPGRNPESRGVGARVAESFPKPASSNSILLSVHTHTLVLGPSVNRPREARE